MKIMYKEAITFHKVALPIFLLLCIIIFLAGCGKIYNVKVVDLNPPLHTILDIPDHGACVKIDDDVWVENEGDHIDVYNNSMCDHGPAPLEALCNNVHEQENCVYQNYTFYIEDTYANMLLHIIRYE